jgi:hypothetical protein
MNQYEINPINSWCNDEVGKLLANRIANMPILQRVEAVSMCQMFSFWREVQECMILAAEEIKTLKAKIQELESRSTT